jgi:hypothetical protein
MSTEFSGSSLTDWQNRLIGVNDELAYMLKEPGDPYVLTQALGLPTPPYVVYDSVDQYWEHPSHPMQKLGELGIDAFYVGLRPKESGLPKFRELGLSAEEVPGYIAANVAPADHGRYVLRVAEYAIAEYGATMIIDRDGTMSVEMITGEMAKLATGEATPKYTAQTDPFTHGMRYSFEDPELRRRDTFATDGRRIRQPGYNEFLSYGAVMESCSHSFTITSHATTHLV